MKKLVICSILALLGFSSLADTSTQWENVLDIFYMTIGAPLVSDKIYPIASIRHKPDHFPNGDSLIFIAIQINTPKDVSSCEANTNINMLRHETILVNEIPMDFSVFCTRISVTDSNATITHIYYFPDEEIDIERLKEQFFVSNHVKFNDFIFPAKGFTKTFNEYKKNNDIK